MACEEVVKPTASSNDTDNLRLRWMSVVFLGLLALITVAAISQPFLVARQRRIQANWPHVRGNGTDIQIVRRRLPGRNFPLTENVCRCAVQYNVAGKDYLVWVSVGSTFVDPDPKFISDMRESCLASRYVVRYRPQDASEAVASRVD